MDEKTPTTFSSIPQGSALEPGSAQGTHPSISPSNAPTLTSSSDDEQNDKKNTDDHGGVDVARAKEEFAELGRTLTRQSSLHRVATGQSKDVEKAEDDFDLLSFFKGSKSAQDEAGFKPKRVGVTWQDLKVVGGGGMKINIRTFPDAIVEQFLMPVLSLLGTFGYKPFAPKPKTILEGFDGVLLPGEMCLVLGRPGSGCSSFLKNIANQRESFLSVEGDVRYAGVDAAEMRKHFPGEVCYNEEDDVHLATLTVGQTLSFALSSKTPGKRLPGVSIKEFRKQVQATLLKMLNIEHTKNTIVGDQFTRGVSGGERKRVSIAEMMAARACVASWDNSTRGLDASTALDYAKSLRILTDVFSMTTFVSLYQAGEGIYDQFDKVLVIDEGRQVYFGPTKEARKYMVGLGYKDLPRQTTADYLSGCTDPNERQFASEDCSSVPSDPAAFAAAYRASDTYKQVSLERDAYLKSIADDDRVQQDFKAAVQDDKRKGVSHNSPYTVSFISQVNSLAKRGFQLKKQDVFSIVTGYATAIIIAIITGTVYYQLPQTAGGAFTRGGTLFIAMLFNALNSFSELPSMMMGRPILYKQTNYKFYRPGAFAIAAAYSEIPFTLPRILIFSIIVYFMAGLATSAGAFFSFFLFVYGTFMVMTAFFRLIGTVTKSYDVAARLASILIISMVLYAGYMIPVFAMKRWLFWIYYINPLNYGFAALMIIEFSRVNLACDGAYIIPGNAGVLTSYPDTIGDYSTCNLAGSVPGQSFVRGSDYILAGYEYRTQDLWRNFGILIAFFLGFCALQVACMEYLGSGSSILAITVFAKEDKDTKVRNEALQEKKQAARRGELEQDLSGLTTAKKPFTWAALDYTVPVSGGHRKLLNDIYGYCKPGTLTALMGASGAGKTTLLDVLAGRKTIGVIGGSRLINGRETGIDFQRGTAYVEQADVHEYTQTVREAFRISAYLRQPFHVSKEEKDAYVEEIIQLLELEDLADAMIGFPGYGLSVEARKRLTIGVELAAKPQLLLFLDEPTSGLDGQSAFNIIRFLKKLAGAGQSILCTIHQPNALLFENFDRLLLLQKGGETVYFGDVGKDSHVLTSYLERNGAPCPHDANPAEFMLEAIGAGSAKRMGGGDWGEKWRNSPELAEIKKDIAALDAEALSKPEEVDPEASREYSTPFLFQLKTIVARTLKGFWRMPDYGYTRLFSHLSISLITSLTFLNLGSSVQDLQYRVFAIFIATVLPAIIISQVEPTYIMSRQTFNREASSRMYSSIVFSTSQLIAEMPYSILCAVGFFVLFYFPMGFQSASDRAGYHFFMILVTEIYSVTLGQAVAAISPSIVVFPLFNPFLLVIFSLFCGVTIPFPQIPFFWRKWMYDLDPFTRLIAGLVSTELHDLKVVCLQSELKIFNPPPGQTCTQWASEYVSAVGGYLTNTSAEATSNCEFCPYALGDQFYGPLGIDFSTRWRDIGILIAFLVFNVMVTLVASRYLRYAKR
ncbi:putative ATP-binding cassette transporter [Mrakia frigida]|uniref:putative ATP-binding cassette transporter n=1 Tax=Mrakia frigida TaxID=29902 RepID=UPI003FCBF702